MNFNFYGTEEVTLELSGWIPSKNAAGILKNGLSPANVNGRTPIRLKLSKIRNSGMKMLPFMSVNYHEAIWSVGVENKGERSWFIPAFDVNSRLLRRLNTFFFKAPLRRAHFLFMEKRKSLITHLTSDTGSLLTCHVEIGPEKQPVADNDPLLINLGNSLCNISSRAEFGDFYRDSTADIVKDELSENLFGAPVEWDAHCLVHRGRTTFSSSIKE